MKHAEIGEHPLYWLTCDHCEDFTLQYDTKEELAEESQEEGWRYNTTLDKHFCCFACEFRYLAKLALKSEKGGQDHESK